MENDRGKIKNIASFPSSFRLRPHWYSFAAKRLVDILAAFFGLLLLAPFFAFLGILIKRDSPGPVFFWGTRVGREGRDFRILKFRTMREEPASYAGPPITGRNDTRITPLGQWLRDTKLNELPQLWNVLVGEMSLVGPRPEAPEFVKTWPLSVQSEILSVRPGITSPASILYRDEETRLKSDRVMDEYMEHILPDKLRLDQLYIRHHTFLGDFDTLFWTFVVLIPRLGDRQISEGWLFGGPVSRFIRRYLNWFAIDFLVALASIGLTGLLWRMTGPLDIGLEKAVSTAVVLAFLFGLFNILLGLRSVSWAHPAAEDVLRLFVSCGLVTAAVILLELAYHPQLFPPARFMSVAGLAVLFGFVAVRYRLRLITGLASRWIDLRHSNFGAPERVLVVGAGEGCEFAAWLLQRREFQRIYTIVGIADDDPAKQGMRYDGVSVLGSTADIPELVKRHDVGVIFYTIARIAPEDNRRILDVCKQTGLHVIMLSEVLDLLHHKLTEAVSRDKPVVSEPLPVREEAENVSV
jgi:lipopolysaccharide/colanic/teichoic acid biosynthesis glycosyltransferase